MIHYVKSSNLDVRNSNSQCKLTLNLFRVSISKHSNMGEFYYPLVIYSKYE